MPLRLHNTTLVIDAENFVNHRYRTSGLLTYYGGEQMDFLVSMRIFLRQLQKCRIRPIFIFDGCHEENGTKRETLLRRNMERIPALNNFIHLAQLTPDTDCVDCGVDLLPKLTNQVALDLLDEFGIPHICCIREADTRIAELAVFLDCPLLSNDSDFYIFQSPYPSRYRVISLTSLSSECERLPNNCSECASSSTRCYGLSCTVYRPTRSSLSTVSPSLIPLLAVLLGNDVISCIRIPDSVNNLVRASKNSCYSAKRVGAMLQWLSRFSNDVSSPLYEIFSGYSTSNLDQLTKQIAHCVQGYFLDPTTGGSELSAALGLPSVLAFVPTPLPSNLHVDLSSISVTTVEEAVSVVARVLSCGGTGGRDADADFCRLWPTKLVRSFRNSQISTSLLDALYVRGGTVLRILYENLNHETSIYKVSERMRLLEYQLFIELENSLDCSQNLRWLTNGSPVENRRNGSRMCTFPMPLPASTIPRCRTALQSFEQFFRQYLFIDLRCISCDSTYAVGIASILVLWLKFSSFSEVTQCLFVENPVVLSFVACALVSGIYFDYLREHPYGNADRALAELCEEYVRLATDAKRECLSAGLHRYSIEIVHQFNELQLVYLELKQLTNLLDIFCTHLSERVAPASTTPPSRTLRLSFWPAWVMFPSGRLLYWLTQALFSVAPHNRFRLLQTKWIPDLLRITLYKLPPPHVSDMPKRVWRLLDTAQQMLNHYSQLDMSMF
ncbi:unnamed protein product [Dicrocoelium dendriticum]|nr:unnamed protein product [Dicrocoelium dendriticum]